MDIRKLLDEGQQLLVENNLIGWQIRLENIGQLLGKCDWAQKLIVISTHYAEHNPEDMVMDTLLHEIAHSLTPGHGHDKVWRAMAMKLGAIPRAIAKHPLVPTPGRYRATCPECERVFYFYCATLV